MPTFHSLKEFMLLQEQETSFDVGTGVFSDLQIRSTDQTFHYFYDTRGGRLIKSFILRAGTQADTMCDVVLIKKADVFTPRLTFWKKDKTKGKPDKLTEDELIAEGRTLLIRARVDLRDCHENFWKLIDFLRTYKGIELPNYEFRVSGVEDAELLRTLQGHEKPEVLAAVKVHLDGQLTEKDVQMLLDRRAALRRFERMLTDADFFSSEEIRLSKVGEGLWQAFFEDNDWIFGYGLTLVACESFNDEKLEQATTGANIFTGGGKRSDAVMRTKGFVQTLLFAEIKKHTTDLLTRKQYRPPDVYQVSEELSGAVSQVQKTTHKAIRKLGDMHREYNPDGQFLFDISTIRPRQLVLIGDLSQLADRGQVNIEKMTSFELYRRDHQDVEILTFDELYARAKYIVESQASD